MNKIKAVLHKYTQGDARSVTIKKNVVASLVIKGVGILTSLLLVPRLRVSRTIWCMADALFDTDLGGFYGHRILTGPEEQVDGGHSSWGVGTWPLVGVNNIFYDVDYNGAIMCYP